MSGKERSKKKPKIKFKRQQGSTFEYEAVLRTIHKKQVEKAMMYAPRPDLAFESIKGKAIMYRNLLFETDISFAICLKSFMWNNIVQERKETCRCAMLN